MGWVNYDMSTILEPLGFKQTMVPNDLINTIANSPYLSYWLDDRPSIVNSFPYSSFGSYGWKTGDSNWGIKFTSGSNRELLEFYYNGSIVWTMDYIRSNQYNPYTMIFLINEDTHNAVAQGYGYSFNSSGQYKWSASGSETSTTLYNFLKHAPFPPTYNFVSVPSLTGKLGTFNFSTLDVSAINEGDPVTGSDGSAIHFVNETRISQLAGNVPFNTEVPLIYAGSVDYMTYEVVALQAEGQPILISAYKLRFYIHGYSTPFYTATLSGGLHAPEINWIHFLIDDDNQVGRLSLIRRDTTSTPVTYTYNNDTFTTEQEETMYLWLKSHIPPEEREDSTDNITNGDEGGNNWNPWHSVDIPKPAKPTKGALTTGFTSMYLVDDTILKELSDVMWTDTFVESLSRFFNDPREIIIGVMLYPITPSAASEATEIKAGGITTGVSAKKITDQYLYVDMGYIDVHKMTNTFLDYPPNTKAIVYLPYCGEHYLDVNEIMGTQLHLEYLFDFLTGAVCANISVNSSFIYSFTGQCGVQIPTSSEDFSRMYSSILSAGATLGTALATISTGGMTAPLMVGAGANMLSNGMNLTPDVSYSSGGGGATGFLANQTPYLRLELPVPLMANGDTSDEDFETTKQYAFLGKPTYQSLTLSSCSGFTKCIDAHLKNIPATETELAQILRDLKEGVIIQTGSDTPTVTPAVEGDSVITFIKCKSAPNIIGKVWETDTDLEGHLIYNHSLLKPKFIIKGDVKEYNYCYVDIFKRFYYITDVVFIQNGMQEVSLSVDPLNSFASDILNCKAVVERQKKKGNLYMTDSHMYTKANKQIVTVPFMGGDNQYINTSGMQSFERQNNSYVLTIAGD